MRSGSSYECPGSTRSSCQSSEPFGPEKKLSRPETVRIPVRPMPCAGSVNCMESFPVTSSGAAALSTTEHMAAQIEGNSFFIISTRNIFLGFWSAVPGEILPLPASAGVRHEILYEKKCSEQWIKVMKMMDVFFF